LSVAANAWLSWALAWVLTGALVGAAVGFARDRLLRGLVLGALLGPIGWYLVARSRSAQVECPGCSRLISARALVCPRCGTNVRDANVRSSRSTLRRAEQRGPWR
jgi:predicted RNA-binding Zn-ribbon protein involved in translation (DUF1610 family)